MSKTKKKVAINGFGRIGRQFLHIALNQHTEFEVVAINDLGDTKTLAHLFEFDSTYGHCKNKINYNENALVVDDKTIAVFGERDPEKLPWKELGVDIVIESTGIFCDREGASKHLTAGAKKVIISAPAKGEAVPTCVLGANLLDFEKENIISNASCTTNCIAPILRVIQDTFGIERGDMVTIHSITNDQRILDLPHSDLRRARTAGVSMIPTTTGAAKAVGLVIPELKGRLDGYAVRVPTVTVSLADLCLELKKPATVKEVHEAFTQANPKYVGMEPRPLVSIDFRGDERSGIVDTQFTRVDGNRLHLTAWYDNEWGYSNRLADLCGLVSQAF